MPVTHGGSGGRNATVSKIYADGVDEDVASELRVEIERLRQRVVDLEGMLEAECRGNVGRSQQILDWLDKTRLPVSPGSE